MFHFRCGQLSGRQVGSIKSIIYIKTQQLIEEADESEFWLEFINEEKLLPFDKVETLKTEAHELASIFIQSGKTAQRNERLRNDKR